ncbi:Uncharacterised protein [Roseomonas mucosa]|uniref:Uncharacterized protein n=1 Tax=Roseomonas mucosa TaxID=207340 RepID=A0A379N5I3_9PROT|nr:Uncharacterised protein [Roseomonas mucosa]
MANPWTKKNPFLSIMLSGANAWAGAARVSIGTELGPQIGTQKGPSCEVC